MLHETWWRVRGLVAVSVIVQVDNSMSEKPGKLATWNFCHSLVEGKGVGSCQRPRTCCRIVCQKLVPQRSFCHSIAWCVCHILMRATYIILQGLVLLVRTNSPKCQRMQYLVTRTLRCFIDSMWPLLFRK